MMEDQLSDMELRKLCLEELPTDLKERWQKNKESRVVDAKSFIKGMPKLVDLIRNGQADVMLTSTVLAEVCTPKFEDIFAKMCLLFTELIIPPANHDEGRAQLLRKKLALQMKIHWIVAGRDGHHQSVEKAATEAMQKYKKEIITFYGGDETFFLNACHIISEQTDRELMSELRGMAQADLGFMGPEFEGFSDLTKDIFIALHQIKDGLDYVRTTCWECSKIVTENSDGNQKIMACTGCQAARYCSRECQLKAWKGGHKKSCPYLNSSYKSFLQNQKIAEKAWDNQETHKQQYEIGPCPFVDFSVAVSTSTLHAQHRFGEASLTAFYKNLGKVNSGLLWMDPLVQIWHMAKELKDSNAQQEGEDMDRIKEDQALRICSSLAYDYNTIEGLEDWEESRAFAVVWGQLGPSLEAAPMSREEFLAWYHGLSKDTFGYEKLGARAMFFDKMWHVENNPKRMLKKGYMLKAHMNLTIKTLDEIHNMADPDSPMSSEELEPVIQAKMREFFQNVEILSNKMDSFKRKYDSSRFLEEID